MKKINLKYDFKYANTSTGTYNMSYSDDYTENYSSLSFKYNLSLEKEEKFKQRISEFNNVQTLQEAKELLQKRMPVCSEKSVFNIGNAKCTIVNEENVLWISFVNDKECIYYNFT